MTIQFSETLVLDGQPQRMVSCPLNIYLTLSGTRHPFSEASTACHRGYVGKWEIVEDRLYLAGIHAHLLEDKPASLSCIFPGYPKRVFAHWFTGLLQIPQGGRIEHINMGFGGATERDLFIEVRRGVQVRCWVRDNAAARADEGEALNTALPMDNVPTVGKPARGMFKSIINRWRRAPYWHHQYFQPSDWPEASDLLQRMTISEIEERETVDDPLHAAPNIPFGFLNSTWAHFAAAADANDDEIWSFQKERHSTSGRFEKFEGYAAVRSGRVVACFFTVHDDRDLGRSNLKEQLDALRDRFHQFQRKTP